MAANQFGTSSSIVFMLSDNEIKPLKNKVWHHREFVPLAFISLNDSRTWILLLSH